MAQQIIYTLIDDMDGKEATGTVNFALDGTRYEIDLSAKNATAFEKALAPFVSHARKIPASRNGRGSRGTQARSANQRERSQDIRAWAKAHGIAVSERGRIPASVVSQYEAR